MLTAFGDWYDVPTGGADDRPLLAIPQILNLYHWPIKSYNCLRLSAFQETKSTSSLAKHRLRGSKRPNNPQTGRSQMSANRPGRYLAQTSSSYMFQIRLPSELDHGRPLIRISLKTRRISEARRLAEALAVKARLSFKAELQRIRPASGGPVTKPSIEAPEAGRDEGTQLAVDTKNWLKAELALMVEGRNPPADGEGGKPLSSPDHDLEHRIKLAARMAVDEFLLEAAELVRQKTEVKLAEAATQILGERFCPSVTPTASSLVTSDPLQSRRKRLPAFKRKPLLSSDHSEIVDGTVPAFLRDRRTVPRKRSKLPRFSIVVDD